MSSSELPLPKVTIAIPTLNRVGYLRLAVASALGQTYGNLEVVVSNNASEDGTAASLASCTDPRLRVLQQTKRLSMAQNWNACLDAAQGQFFLLLSDDDLLEPDAIREMVKAFQSEANESAVGLVYAGGSFIDADGLQTIRFRNSPQRESARDLILASLDGKRDLFFCAVLLRTADVRPAFPENFAVACDAAVWMRTVLQRGYAVFVAKPLVQYRRHHSLTYTTPVDTWLRDQIPLRAIIDREDELAGRPDPAFLGKLDAVMRRSDMKLATGWINHAFKGRRGRALLEYKKVLHLFLSVSGIYYLSRGLAVLAIGENGKAWIRRLLHKGALS